MAADTVCTGANLIFNDQTPNNPNAWSWNFGDGGTSSAQNPSHNFNQSGTFTVTLTASNPNGSSVFTDTVTVISCAGLEDVETHAISILPNPFQNALTLNGLQAGNIIRVVKLDGTIVLTHTSKDTEAVLSTELWSKGAYFVEIDQENTRQVQLVVKE